jgi:hypothetical protein
MNILLYKEEEYYPYSLRVGGKFCPLIGVRSLSLLRKRCKNLSPRFCDLFMIRFMIIFPSVLPWIKPKGGDILKIRDLAQGDRHSQFVLTANEVTCKPY